MGRESVQGAPADEGEVAMLLIERILPESKSPFHAYMELQRRLMHRWVARGGSEQAWCERMAPVFHARYGPLIEQGS